MFLWVLQIYNCLTDDLCFILSCRWAMEKSTTTMKHKETLTDHCFTISIFLLKKTTWRPGPVHLSSHILLSVFIFHTQTHTQRKCGRVLDACSVWQLTKCHMDVTGFYNLNTREHNLHSNYERRKRRRSRAGKHLDRLEGDGRSTMWAAVGGEFRGGTALLRHTFFRVLTEVGLLTMT